MSDLPDRLREQCNGQPATITWPHRVLHEAAAEIERLRRREDDARFLIEMLTIGPPHVAKDAEKWLRGERVLN